jgi:hypothetical protein
MAQRKTSMPNVLWFLNRAAATLVGAVAIGCVAAAIIFAASDLTCGQPCASAPVYGTETLPYHGSEIAVVIMCAVALGLVPGLIALTLTPARNRPWRSLPLLVLGTNVGFGMWLWIGYRFPMMPGTVTALVLLCLIPSATGLMTAFNVDRFTRRRTPTPG